MRSSSKFSSLSQQSKLSYLSERLQNLSGDNDDDSSEYDGDSGEDLDYRDSQSTRKMQTFVRSRALSKKIQKLSNRVSKKTSKRSGLFIGNKVYGLTSVRSTNNNGLQGGPYQQSSSTTTRSSANTVTIGGNVFLSIPVGYVANSVSTTTTRLITEQEAIRLGLLSAMSGSVAYSSTQNTIGLNSAGSSAGRSINSNSMSRSEYANGYYSNSNLRSMGNTQKQYSQSQQYNNLASMNDLGSYQNQNAGSSTSSRNINASQRQINNNHYSGLQSYGTGNQMNQNTGAKINYRNIKTSEQVNKYSSNKNHNTNINNNDYITNGANDGDNDDEDDGNSSTTQNGINKSYQNNVVKKDSEINISNKGNQINQSSHKSELKHVTQKIGVTKVDGTTKSSGSSSDDSSKSCENTTNDDEDNDDDKSKSVALNKHRSRTEYSQSTNIKKTAKQSIGDGNQNGVGSNSQVKSEIKKTVNITHKRSMGAVSQRNLGNSEEERGDKDDDGQNSNEDDDDENDDNEDDSKIEDEVSVYEHLKTFHKFRFDVGLNSVGIISEVLNQLDYQRYKLMDDIVYPQDFTRYVTNEEYFDFIIVGGGNSGSVLANKLSENANWKILLIEAGGDPLPVTQIPGLWDRTLNTITDWQYKLEPDSTTGFGIDGHLKVHKGKCLGGSSTTSAQLYVRGSEKLYNSLVTKGLTDWSYNVTETYFKKVEKIRTVTKTVTTSTSIYGNCGLIPVNKFRKTEVNVLEKIICSSFEHVGCKKELDINDKDIEVGFVSMQGIIKNGRSFNTAKAYLGPTYGRENLKVMKYATVTKVVVDKTKLSATGVEVRTKFGQTLMLKTRMEVLLCAGSIGSAQILLSSGIGPKKHLSEMDVPVVKDLPVGKKFLVAPVFAGFVVSYDKSIVSNQTNEEIAFKYLSRHSGPLSIPKGMAFGGFFNTGMSESKFADIEVHQFYIPRKSYSKLCQLKSMFGFSDSILSEYARLNNERAISVFTIALINTKSTGRVLLRSKNPFENPTVVANMLSDKKDVNTLIEGIKLLSGIVKSDAMKLVDARLEDIDIDGCAKYDPKTEAHWNCLLKYMVSTTSSTAGSCRMGLETDADAVVDGKLNVIGIANLRVVGRTVLPMITSAYSHIPCIMVAEKAADMIQSKYNPVC